MGKVASAFHLQLSPGTDGGVPRVGRQPVEPSWCFFRSLSANLSLLLRGAGSPQAGGAAGARGWLMGGCFLTGPTFDPWWPCWCFCPSNTAMTGVRPGFHRHPLLFLAGKQAAPLVSTWLPLSPGPPACVGHRLCYLPSLAAIGSQERLAGQTPVFSRWPGDLLPACTRGTCSPPALAVHSSCLVGGRGGEGNSSPAGRNCHGCPLSLRLWLSSGVRAAQLPR